MMRWRRLLQAISIIVLAVYFYLFIKKRLFYRSLKNVQQDILDSHGDEITFAHYSTEHLPSFKAKIASIPNFLPDREFAELRDTVLRQAKMERSYLPGHKQGGAISYEALHFTAPKAIAFYHSYPLRKIISDVVGEQVVPTPLHDQSSCSLLFYQKPGDHIGWHYDYNFYNGRHFTILLPLVNEHLITNKPSSTKLMVRQTGRDIIVATTPNTLVILEGAKVLHKVTKLEPNELRILLSMTFCTSPKTSMVKDVSRRFKDTAFFGIRALWT